MPTTLRLGLTLLELLIVIFIILTLTVVTVPLMSPSTESRRLREAARGLDTFISGARARAIQSGRPVAVIIFKQRQESASGSLDARFASIRVQHAEIPLPFSGALEDDKAQIRYYIQSQLPYLIGENEAGALFATFIRLDVKKFVRIGDHLQVDNRAEVFQVQEVITPGVSLGNQSTSASLKIQVLDPGTLMPVNQIPPWLANNWSHFYSFKIYRQPMAPDVTPTSVQGGGTTFSVRSLDGPNAAAPPSDETKIHARRQASGDVYQLPDGTAIDLMYSGTRGWNFISDDFGGTPSQYPIAIVFNPNGSVQRIHYGYGKQMIPAGPIHLLVGKREKIPDQFSTDAAYQNIQDLACLWVTINNRTGQVTTEAMAPISASTVTQSNIHAAIHEARQHAYEGKGLGGR